MTEAKGGQATAVQIKNAQYENTVIDFVQKESGCFLVVSTDQAFVTAFRSVLQKHLAITAANTFSIISEPGMALKRIKETDAAKRRPLVLLERRIDGQDMTFMVKQLKEAYPKLLMIILTADVEKHRIMYLHEMGADNFIAKPVSAQTIIEKLAFTIKPQSQLGVLIDSAKEYLDENRPERARLTAHQILEIKPGSAAGLMVLGDAEMALGNMDKARDAYLEASENASLYMEPLRKLAVLAEKTGELEACLGYLEQLDKLSPLNSEGKINMGEINLNLGNESKAEELFDAALTQATKDAMDEIGSLAERVAAIYAEKDPARSEQFLRKALTVKQKYLSREDVHIFNRLGVSLRQQGKWEEAITEYKQALKLSPKDETLYYNTGMAYAEGNNYQEARRHMEHALKLNEQLLFNSPGVAYNFGLVFFKTGDKDKAKHCLKTALELKPDMQSAKLLLAKL